MTEESWIRGMAELSMLPSKGTFPAQAQLLGQVYREELGHLTDEAWRFAVREAIRRDRWFPTVAALLEYSDEHVSNTRLLGPARPDGQRDLDREEAKRGLKAILKHCPWLMAEKDLSLP
jgi:hypothetical protein